MGESSLDFVARVWIVDPVDGVVNVRSALLLAIWDALTAADIEIPYPQRDLHVREPLVVRLERSGRTWEPGAPQPAEGGPPGNR